MEKRNLTIQIIFVFTLVLAIIFVPIAINGARNVQFYKNAEQMIENEAYQDALDELKKIDGAKYKDTDTLIELCREKLAAASEEQERKRAREEAEAEKERKSRYANVIPFEGMDEKYIDYTLAGPHDEYEPPEKRLVEMGTSERTYKWKADGTDKTVLIVSCSGGKVNSVIKYSEAKYWTADGKPNFSASVSAPETKVKAIYGDTPKSTTKSTTKSSSSKKTYHDNYDDGYNDIYDDDDYDWDRYRNDEDYARGVDDALDDLEEYGEDW